MTFTFLRTQALPEPSTSGHRGTATQPGCHSRCVHRPGVMQESSPFSFHLNFRPCLLRSRWALENPSFPLPPCLFFPHRTPGFVCFSVFLVFKLPCFLPTHPVRVCFSLLSVSGQGLPFTEPAGNEGALDSVRGQKRPPSQNSCLAKQHHDNSPQW